MTVVFGVLGLISLFAMTEQFVAMGPAAMQDPARERKLYWSFDKVYRTRRPTLKDAVDWAGNLTGNTGIRTFKGRF
jgi:hypothetical protein